MAILEDELHSWANTDFGDGDGLHRDIFKSTLLLMEAGHDDDTIYRTLRKAADAVSERRIPDRELKSAIRSGRLQKAGMLELNSWPKPIPELRAEIVSKSPITNDHLRSWSYNLSRDPVFWLKTLYKPNDLVCVAANAYSFSTKARPTIETVLGTHKLEYINPSPMSAEVGITQEGKQSAHCLDNVGHRTYLVIEFDYGTYLEHAAILWHIATKIPLLMMVWSGSKSIHGWFSVESFSESHVKQAFTEACTLGADPKMFSKAQFSRLPCGMNNKTQKLQKVVFFEPQHLHFKPE
jgi:hypothetical protein